MSRTMNAQVTILTASLKEIERASKHDANDTCWVATGEGVHPSIVKRRKNGIVKFLFKRLIRFDCGHVCCFKCAIWEDEDCFFCFKCGSEKKPMRLFYTCDKDVVIPQ